MLNLHALSREYKMYTFNKFVEGKEGTDPIKQVDRILVFIKYWKQSKNQ